MRSPVGMSECGKQKDEHNRCSVEDYVRRRSCDRCRASGSIARRTREVKQGLNMNLDKA